MNRRGNSQIWGYGACSERPIPPNLYITMGIPRDPIGVYFQLGSVSIGEMGIVRAIPFGRLALCGLTNPQKLKVIVWICLSKLSKAISKCDCPH